MLLAQARPRVKAIARPVRLAADAFPANCKKKRQRKAGVKLLRQVSYRQETYRAVGSLYAAFTGGPS
jgi:hypothetical protein